MTRIGRDEILDGLAEVARRAGHEGVSVKVHVLGGSAVALLLRGERRLTGDVDAHIVANERGLATITRVAAEVAAERGLRPPPQLLLAMKLNTPRGRRDTQDLQGLVDACGLTTREQIEEVFDRFFPDDAISRRSADWLDEHGYTVAPASTPGQPLALPPDRSADSYYVDTHLRAGKWVQGHWRKRRT